MRQARRQKRRGIITRRVLIVYALHYGVISRYTRTPLNWLPTASLRTSSEDCVGCLRFGCRADAA